MRRDPQESNSASQSANVLIADAPSTMTAWTGVLLGPIADGDGMDEALALLQAELDEKGRSSQYQIEVEHGDGVFGTRTTVTAWIGVLIGVIAPIVILLSRAPTLGLAATLVFVLAGIGPGIMCWVDAGDSSVQAALSMVLGTGAFALAAVTMIWLSAWHPTALLLLAVPGVLSCLYRLYAGRGAPSTSGSTA